MSGLTKCKVLASLSLWMVCVASGWVSAQSPPTVDQVRLSPHRTVRSSRTISKVLIHTIEGSYRGAVSWFQNPRSRVSAHYTISRTGQLTRSVEEKNIAWHAGNWSYNAVSIGIEHEGYAGRADTWNHTAMLRKSAELTRYLCLKYGIPMDRQHIIGHVEVPNQSHWDPGPHFPWSYYMALVQQGASASATPTPSSSTPSTPAPEVVQTTASWLNVRTRAWGSRLGSIPRGSRFVRRESRGGWCRIDWRGRSGWVHEGYVQPLSGQTVHTVTASRLNVRTGGSTRRSRIGSVRKGQQYVEIGSSGIWKRIWFSSRSGWFHGKYTTSEKSR